MPGASGIRANGRWAEFGRARGQSSQTGLKLRIAAIARKGNALLSILRTAGVSKGIDGYPHLCMKGGAPPSIVVLVDVSPVVGPGSRADRIKAIEDTWAHSAPHHVQVSL